MVDHWCKQKKGTKEWALQYTNFEMKNFWIDSTNARKLSCGGIWFIHYVELHRSLGVFCFESCRREAESKGYCDFLTGLKKKENFNSGHLYSFAYIAGFHLLFIDIYALVAILICLCVNSVVNLGLICDRTRDSG